MAKTKTDLSWQELEIGAIVINPGNAAEYKTGDWRSIRPVWDTKRCVRCGACYVFCPDAAVCETEEGYFEAELYMHVFDHVLCSEHGTHNVHL